MKLNSLKEAIADYERITGETVENYKFYEQINDMFFDPINNKYMIVLPSNEWCIFAICEREGLSYLHLDQCYGYMKNLAVKLVQVMEATKVTVIATSTQRNPKYHCRKWKLKRLPEHDFDVEGRHYYFMVGDIDGLKESFKWG